MGWRGSETIFPLHHTPMEHTLRHKPGVRAGGRCGAGFVFLRYDEQVAIRSLIGDDVAKQPIVWYACWVHTSVTIVHA